MATEGTTAGRWSASEIVGRLREAASALERGDVEAARSLIDRTCDALAPPTPVVAGSVRLGCVTLTDREVATLRLLPDGSMSQKDIARALDVSRNTVKTHLKSLYQKLGVHCRAEAIHRARELGVLLRRPDTVGPPDMHRRPLSLADRATA